MVKTSYNWSSSSVFGAFWPSIFFNRSINSSKILKNIKLIIFSICKKEFYLKSHRDIHISTVHEGVKLNMCTTCGSNFRTKKALNEHIETTHNGVVMRLSCKQ